MVRHNNLLEDLECNTHQKEMEEAKQKRDSVLHKYKELCAEKGIAYRVISREKQESIGQDICTIAKEMHALCIVLGQRGLGTIKRTIYGSVSEYVLHHAHITVLIVPPPKDEK